MQDFIDICTYITLSASFFAVVHTIAIWRQHFFCNSKQVQECVLLCAGMSVPVCMPACVSVWVHVTSTISSSVCQHACEVWCV